MTPTVFLCEPSGLSPAQREESDRWHERLFTLGFDVDQLRSHAYEPDPWTGLLARMHAADGVLVLGFGQLVVTDGTWRRGTGHESRVAAIWTTPWLQVEAGMALASGVPLLVAPEPGVCEGVFATDTWTGLVNGTALEAPDPDVLDAWAAEVVSRCASTVPASLVE